MVDPIDIVVTCGSYSFTGSIDHQNRRVLDVLNDGGSEYLRLYEVNVSHSAQSECIAKCDSTIVAKANIDFVILLRKNHEAPLRKQFAMVEKRSHKARVVIGEHLIRGELMFQGRPDPVRILGRDAPPFFPIIEANVSTAGNVNHSVPGEVALLNKIKVSLLQIDDQHLNL